jgi:hypothetical protein
MTENFAKNLPHPHARQAEVLALAATAFQPGNVGRPCETPSDLARDSNPTTHLAFVLQIRLAEFRGEISLLAKDHAVMKNQDE